MLNNTTILHIDDDVILFNESIIDKHQFENWLIENDLLDWVDDQCCNGEHHQKSGTFTFEQYYDSRYVESDILLFIKQNKQS